MSAKFLPLYLIVLFFIGDMGNANCQDASKAFVSPSNKTHNDNQPLLFIENKNQWADEVLYKVAIRGNMAMFIEDDGFTYNLVKKEDVQRLHFPDQINPEDKMHYHAYQVKFEGAQTSDAQGVAKKNAYYNYFIGNNPEKWASNVGLYGKIQQQNVYPGIHLETYSRQGKLKYDWTVAPNADPSQIKMTYSGADSIAIRDNILHIYTTVTEIKEMQPIAFQYIDDEQRRVPCEYRLDGTTVSFEFPEEYDANYELIIDPVVVGATLSGTVGSANFGHSATYDNAGNIYGGARSFGIGYPTTTGAYQATYGGGGTDIAISKYTPDGSDLLYASYLGGTNSDFPHSTVVNFDQQIYVLGSSASSDYPVTGNAFQSNNGGSIDMVVSALSSDGTQLIGSSYFGGGAQDGVNISVLNEQYDDKYRGEIILDGQSNVYVVSATRSDDFPVTANAYDTQIGSFSQDAIVMKANSDLSVLFWATYLGGDENDIGGGIRLDDDLNVYVTGTAGDDEFPTTTGAFMTALPQGTEEIGYVSKISADGTTLMQSTFFGSIGGDTRSYLMDIDELNQIHIYGLTSGNLDITPDTYFFNPGSSVFLASLTEDLSEVVYSTVIGTGQNTLQDQFSQVPVAFMVDKCNGIYFSLYYAPDGMPLTSDAISTAGQSFYLGVLTPDADDLIFGTYYGQADHVDGGTSRFDKGGVVYQGVCSCESGDRIMNTLPNAWATDQTEFCDIGVFKIDFEIETIIANGQVLPATSGCAPFEVDFNYTGQNATEWEWYFPDGTIGDTPNPTYTFEEAGNYEIPLVVKNPNTCNFTDTFFIQIDVLDDGSNFFNENICIGGETFLDVATSNATYAWNTGATGPTVLADQEGIYWVDISILGCSRRDSFLVENFPLADVGLPTDTTYCDVGSIDLTVESGALQSYQWQDGSTSPVYTVTASGNYFVEVVDTFGCDYVTDIDLTLSETLPIDLGPDSTLCGGYTYLLTPETGDADILWSNGAVNDPDYLIEESGVYWIELDNEGCLSRDSVEFTYLPEIELETDGSDVDCADNCTGQVGIAYSGGSGTGYQVLWQTGDTDDDIAGLCPGDYTVTITDSNNCTTSTAVTITSPPPLEMLLTVQDVECAGDEDGAIEITAVDGGVPPYQYGINTDVFTDVNGAAFLSGGEYIVITEDANGCQTVDTVDLFEPTDFVIDAGENIFVELGQVAQANGIIEPYFGQQILWDFPDSLDCDFCFDPSFYPFNSGVLNFLVVDTISGCFKTDSLLVFVEKNREFYFPNVFSPNGDGENEIFTGFGDDGVTEILELRIYSRWGNLVYENINFPHSIQSDNTGWNGTHRGRNLNPGVFAYYARVLFEDGLILEYEGDVTLLR